MDVKEVLFETLWESPSSLLAKLKWSLEISLKCMLDQPEKPDMQTVLELMEKSSADCLTLTIKILKDLPRLDLVHELSQADFVHKNKDTIQKILKTLKSLTCAEYKKLISSLENELAHIWKQRLDGADLLQVVELMELMFTQDPAVLTKKALEKMGRRDLMDKLSYRISAAKDTSDAEEHIYKTLSRLSLREFKQFMVCSEMYLPNISELQEANCWNIVDLMETNSFKNCVESTEKVFKRMERPDLVYKLSHSTSATTEKMAIKKHIWKTLRGLALAELRIFKDCLRMYLPHIPLSQLENADCKEVVEMMELNNHQQCVTITQEVLKWMERPDLADKLSDPTSRTSEILTTKACIWETLKDLSDSEFDTFSWHLKMYLPQISESELQEADFQSIVRLMEMSLHRNCVEITQQALRKINRLDLVQRLSDVTSQNYGSIGMLMEVADLMDGSIERSESMSYKKPTLRGRKHGTGRRKYVFNQRSGHVLDPHCILDQKVEEMESVIAGLLDTLGGLSDVELQMFQSKLTNLLHLTRTLSLDMEPQETVFWIVQHYGQQSLEVVMDVFVDMGQTDVAQRLKVRYSEHAEHAGKRAPFYMYSP